VIWLPRSVRVFFATAPMDMRRSFDGLSNAVTGSLSQNPLSGHVFVFVNRRRNQVKLLTWTRGGFSIIHKRLERGVFSFPSRISPDATCVSLDVHELSMLLEGVDIGSARTSRRWEPPQHATM